MHEYSKALRSVKSTHYTTLTLQELRQTHMVLDSDTTVAQASIILSSNYKTISM